MKLITCITFIWAFTLPLSAQLLDNFDDGNLTESPSWSGDIDSFTINQDKMLQLNAQDGGTSAIFTDLDFPDSIIWRFDVRTDFIPSSSNLFRVILAADHTDVSSMTGYVIEAGENGSPDPLCFYALDKGQMNLLACSEGLFEEQVDHTFQLTYTANGNWLLQSKQASESWRDILALNEPIQPNSFSHFGLQCTYTKSRANHFFYDNISIDRIRPDTTPPQLIAHQIKNDSVICLYFDEALAQIPGISAIKFKPDRQIKHIHKINNSVLEIKLSESLISAQPYQVLLDGIRDLHDNELRDTSLSILYWNSRPPLPGDIIFTEVLPDPDPVIGLPNIEYIELYNRTPSPINTADMAFTINDRSIPLPPNVIHPLLLP